MAQSETAGTDETAGFFVVPSAMPSEPEARSNLLPSGGCFAPSPVPEHSLKARSSSYHGCTAGTRVYCDESPGNDSTDLTATCMPLDCGLSSASKGLGGGAIGIQGNAFSREPGQEQRKASQHPFDLWGTQGSQGQRGQCVGFQGTEQLLQQPRQGECYLRDSLAMKGHKMDQGFPGLKGLLNASPGANASSNDPENDALCEATSTVNDIFIRDHPAAADHIGFALHGLDSTCTLHSSSLTNSSIFDDQVVNGNAANLLHDAMTLRAPGGVPEACTQKEKTNAGKKIFKGQTSEEGFEPCDALEREKLRVCAKGMSGNDLHRQEQDRKASIEPQPPPPGPPPRPKTPSSIPVRTSPRSLAPRGMELGGAASKPSGQTET